MGAASWSSRLWAWLIDIAVINVFAWFMLPDYMHFTFWHGVFAAFVSFVYWALMESDGRQSVGKFALNLKTVKENGKDLDLKTSAINSFGKSFVPPVDVVAGHIKSKHKKQRLFHMATDTKVVKKK